MSGHQEKHYSIFEIAINLAGACLVSGLIIALVFSLTKDTAEQKRIMMKNEAMKKLVSQANNFVAIEGRKDWYKAEKDGQALAFIVPSESKGYGGALKLIVAIDLEGKVIDYKILQPIKETPGLGDKAAKDTFRVQFKGKGSGSLVVTKDPANKDAILALSGATITSRGVTKGVKAACDEVAKYLEVKQ